MKDTFYFPHDYHARHDPKLEKLRMLHGCVTDGIYWCLIEMMYEQGGYLLIKDVSLFSKMLNVDEDLILLVLTSDLFVHENGKCHSPSLIKRLTHINKVRKERKQSGKLGGEANAKHLRSNIKESKVKESKEYNISSPQLAGDLKSICLKYRDVKNYQSIDTKWWARNMKVAKELLATYGNVAKVMWAIDTLNTEFRAKNLEWKLETVLKRYEDLSKPQVRYE